MNSTNLDLHNFSQHLFYDNDRCALDADKNSDIIIQRVLQYGLFPDGSIFLVLKRLSFFVDAERDLMPTMDKPLKWEHVKEHITSETNKYIKKKL